MNNVVLIGRLTKDPELRYIPSTGNANTRFTLAVDKQLSRDKKQEMESKDNRPRISSISAYGKAGGKLRQLSCQRPSRCRAGSYSDQQLRRTGRTTQVLDRSSGQQCPVSRMGRRPSSGRSAAAPRRRLQSGRKRGPAHGRSV